MYLGHSDLWVKVHFSIVTLWEMETAKSHNLFHLHVHGLPHRNSPLGPCFTLLAVADIEGHIGQNLQ